MTGDADDAARGAVTLGDLEREVMEVLWAGEEATVRSVLGALNATSGRSRAYTTVMTVMGNLTRKGLLTRRREGRTDVYRAVFSREAYAEVRAREQVRSLIDDYGDVALAHFARELDALDPERRRQLRELMAGD